MLHLILGILKVIGILLLVLLGILLLFVLALAFVPVRYELAGKKKEGAAAVRGRITWLLHALSVTAGYRDGHLQVRLKVLCFTLFKFGTAGEKGGRQSKRKGKGNIRRKTEPGEKKTKSITAGNTEPKESEAILFPEENAKPEPAQEESAGPQQEKPKTGPVPEESAGAGKEKSEPVQKEKAGNTGRSGKLLSGLTDKLQGLWQGILKAGGFVLSLPQRLSDLMDKLQDMIWGIAEGPEHASQILDGLQQKIKPYTESASIELYKRMLKRAKYLWKHFGPRKLSGWLHFGTGAPDITGQLTGLIYLILPSSAGDFEVRPDFTEQVLEADALIKGHVRACHLLRVALGLWRDKELRKIIRRIKGGD